MPETQRRAAHARAAAYWADRGDGLEETHHRIEAGDLEGAASRLIEIGPGFAESARAGDLEAALLRVPRGPCLEELRSEAEMFLVKFTEARAGLERIVAGGTPSERLRARIRLGRIANRLGSYADSRTMLGEAVQEAAALSDRTAEGEALRALGAVERRLGDMSAAIGHLERAATILEDGSREKIRALVDLGAALIAQGDIPRAKARLTEAAAMSRHRTRDDAAIQINLGIVLSREGEPHQAAVAFERSAEIALGAGDVRFASIALANAVENFLRLEAVEAAATSAERALRLAQTIGDPVAVSTAQANLGLVFAKRGDWAKAEQNLLGSVELIARLDNPYSLASRYQDLAQLYEAQGRGADAAPWKARADDLFARLPAGTPAPANYTYTWRVRDFFFRLLNQTANGPATFLYPIALSYTGTLRFDVTVNDGQGLVVGSPVQSAAVAPAYMALSLDRGDYNPGDTISAYYSVASHVITRPTYTYEVDDSAATVVFSGATNYTFFSFTTPNPSSRFYLFRVTATDRGNSTQALATIAQASGFVLGVTFDKPSYVPGEVIHARLALTARGPASWPSQFRWSLTIGAVTATAITTAPAADFTLTLPAGTGGGGIVLFASEASTGATAIQSVPMAAGGVGFWSTDVGGAPVYAIVLGLLFLLLLVGVVGLWRRTGGGFRFLHRGTPPPPPEGASHAPAAPPR